MRTHLYPLRRKRGKALHGLPTRLLAALGLLCLCLAPAWAGQLVVGGTGSAGPLVEALFREYQNTAPGLSLRVVDPPLGSDGSLKALEAGRIHLAVRAKPLAPDEAGRFGAAFALARTALVMASRDGARKAGFSLAELAQVYAGTLREWDDGAAIRLVLRNSQESDTLALRAMSPEMDAAAPQAALRPGMAFGGDDLDALELILNAPGSLGPTTLGLLASTGKRATLYPINGVAPTLAALESGAYPWDKLLYVVLPRDPNPDAAGFAAFLRTAQAREALRRNGYLPLVP